MIKRIHEKKAKTDLKQTDCSENPQTGFTRRGFLGVGATLATVSFVGSMSKAQGSPVDNKILNEPPKRIYVESEFAPLKRVVLSQSQIKPPDADMFTPEELAREVSIFPSAEKAIIMQLFGKDMADVFPERQRRWEAERTALKRVFEKYNIDVLRPTMLRNMKRMQGVRWAIVTPMFVIPGSLLEDML